MLIPSMNSSGMIESKPLRNGLLIAGVSIVAVGIALSCIPHVAARMTGQVCLTVGAPLLAVGVILAIYQKATEAPRSENQAEQRSCFRKFLDRCRAGGNQQDISDQKLAASKRTLGN